MKSILGEGALHTTGIFRYPLISRFAFVILLEECRLCVDEVIRGWLSWYMRRPIAHQKAIRHADWVICRAAGIICHRPARSMDFDWNTVWTQGFPPSWVPSHKIFPRALQNFDSLSFHSVFFLSKLLSCFFLAVSSFQRLSTSSLVSVFLTALFSLCLPSFPWPLSGLSLGAHSACWKVTESSRMTRWNRWVDSLIFLSKRHTKYRTVFSPSKT